MSKVSNRLKMCREQLRYTQSDLSKLINISNKSISDYERGITSPDLDTLKIFADFFNVSTDYLLGRTDTPTKEVSLQEDTDDFQFALYGEVRELTDEDKEDILEYARFKKQQQHNKK
jgi:Predicted transcriptional regulators